jgi:peptidoglycan/xylan/chitin deacetylase (PgdA/CDA1 family)
MNIRSLMYHDVTAPDRPSGFEGAGADHYKLDRKSFGEHLDAIAAAVPNGTPRIEQLLDGTREGVVLTFDDGGVSALHPIADELEQRGLIGHFFVTSDRVGSSGFMSAAELRELDSRGHVIGSHSASHPLRIDRLADDALATEWRRSRESLESVIGKPVTTASIPGGHYTHRVADFAERAGYAALFTSEPSPRVVRHGSTVLLGRYAIVRTTSAATAAAMAAGPCVDALSQWLLWNAKKPVKRWAFGAYHSVRESLLARPA